MQDGHQISRYNLCPIGDPQISSEVPQFANIFSFHGHCVQTQECTPSSRQQTVSSHVRWLITHGVFTACVNRVHSF